MTKSLRVAVQYVTANNMNVHVAPYLNKSPVSMGIDVNGLLQALPEANHWKLSLSVQVTASSADESICMESQVSLDAIVVCLGFEPVDAAEAVKAAVAPMLFAQARALISANTANTGYGPVILPPGDAAKIIEAVVELPSLAELVHAQTE